MSCINCDDNGFKIMYLHGDRVKVFCDWCKGGQRLVDGLFEDILSYLKTGAEECSKDGTRTGKIEHIALMDAHDHIKEMITNFKEPS